MGTPGRNEQRKAETRTKITTAANALFLEYGYAATSMEDISREAEVAIRTIYLHFDSKAAVLLALHDAWLDEFVALVAERTTDEGVDEAMTRALDTMNERGWGMDMSVEDVRVLPAVPEFIGAGSPEIAGHMMQGWVAAMDRLTRRFRELSGAPIDDPRPRFEAVAVFGAWMSSVLDFRDRHADSVPSGSAHDIGARAIRSYVTGLAGATSPGTPPARG